MTRQQQSEITRTKQSLSLSNAHNHTDKHTHSSRCYLIRFLCFSSSVGQHFQLHQAFFYHFVFDARMLVAQRYALELAIRQTPEWIRCFHSIDISQLESCVTVSKRCEVQHFEVQFRQFLNTWTQSLPNAYVSLIFCAILRCRLFFFL